VCRLGQQAFVPAGNPFTARVGDQDCCVLQQLAAARRAVTRNPVHIASVYRSSGICDWRLGCRLTDLPTSRFADSGQPLFDIDFATHCHIETPLGRARLAEHPCLLAAQNTPPDQRDGCFPGNSASQEWLSLHSQFPVLTPKTSFGLAGPLLLAARTRRSC